ncbi:MAG: hypothetical protein OXH09_02145, partial [Gammaproteobacteria bacterium]|nr:hypothetical protein [Gammaproteobacteria bacterium]
ADRLPCSAGRDQGARRRRDAGHTPPLPPEGIFASHGNRYWIWDPHDGCLPANVRIERILLEDLLLAVTTK